MNERVQIGNRVVGPIVLSPTDAASQETVAGSAQRVVKLARAPRDASVQQCLEYLGSYQVPVADPPIRRQRVIFTSSRGCFSIIAYYSSSFRGLSKVVIASLGNGEILCTTTSTIIICIVGLCLRNYQQPATNSDLWGFAFAKV